MVLRSPEARANCKLERAEALSEGKLLLVGEILIVEHQDSVPIHPLMDGGNVSRRQWLRKIDAIDLPHKGVADLTDGDCHSGVSPEVERNSRITGFCCHHRSEPNAGRGWISPGSHALWM